MRSELKSQEAAPSPKLCVCDLAYAVGMSHNCNTGPRRQMRGMWILTLYPIVRIVEVTGAGNGRACLGKSPLILNFPSLPRSADSGSFMKFVGF